MEFNGYLGLFFRVIGWVGRVY